MSAPRHNAAFESRVQLQAILAATTGYLHMAQDISDRKRADDVMRQQPLALGERRKDMTGLYTVSKLAIDDQLTTDQWVQHIVTLLRPAFQSPEATGARSSLWEKEFTTSASVETAWAHSAPIHAQGNDVGPAEICYRAGQLTAARAPFLPDKCLRLQNVGQVRTAMQWGTPPLRMGCRHASEATDLPRRTG